MGMNGVLERYSGSREMVDERLLKVAIVVSNPIQHFCPFYRAIAADGRVLVRVFFASDAGLRPFFDAQFARTIRWQDDLVDGFEHEFLANAHSVDDSRKQIKNAHVGERLAAFNPDVVLAYGYIHPWARATIRWSRKAGKKVLFCADSELLASRSVWKRLIKRFALPWVFRQCDGFLTMGDCNQEYYRHYGVQWNRLFSCPIPVDEARLLDAVRSRAQARDTLRTKFGLPPEALVALVVGKLTRRKCVDHAIRAISMAWKAGLEKRVFLLAVGDGAERAVLESLAQSLQPEAVKFAGFVDVSVLPSYYAGADLLIHPSSEDPHPLATTEAVFCRLPVIASDRVGSVGPTDDVRVGVNGFQYRFGDLNELARIIVHLCSHPDALVRMSLQSERIAQQRTLGISVEAFVNAVREVCRRETA